jgi:hypothetical protein
METNPYQPGAEPQQDPTNPYASPMAGAITGEAGAIIPYESGHTRAMLAAFFLVLAALTSGLAIWAYGLEYGLATRIASGGFVTEEEASADDLRIWSVAIGQLAALVGAAITFLFWIHRAHRNLPALRAENLEYSPGWAVAYWFIPIVWFWRPYQVVSEIWRASDPAILAPEGWQGRKAPLVGWWWTFWLTDSLISYFTRRVTTRVDSADGLAGACVVEIATNSLSIVAAGFAIAVVLGIDRRQKMKNDRLTASETV